MIAPASSIVIRMHPDVRRDLALHRQLDHVHGRLIPSRSARSTSERTFKFPDRCITRPPDRIERDAGAGLTAIAFDFHPAVAAVQAFARSLARAAPARRSLPFGSTMLRPRHGRPYGSPPQRV